MGKDTVIIGLDPAFREGGFGAAIIEQGVVTFGNIKNFADFLNYCDIAPDGALWCVENSNMDNTTYEYLRGGNTRTLMAKSRDVGKNQAISQVVCDYLIKKFGEQRVTAISPRQKGAKWGMFNGKRNMSIAREIARTVGEQSGLKSIGWQTATGDEVDAFQVAMHLFHRTK